MLTEGRPTPRRVSPTSRQGVARDDASEVFTDTDGHPSPGGTHYSDTFESIAGGDGDREGASTTRDLNGFTPRGAGAGSAGKP